jgi:hypothetical protein
MSGNIGALPQSFRGYVGVALETAFGDGPTPQAFIDVTSDGFSIDNQTDYQNTTRSRAAHKGEAGPLSDEGSIDLPANPENGIGYILKAAMGAETFTASDPGSSGSDTVGEHVFHPANDDTLPSLAVEVDRDTDVNRHSGVGVNSLELSHAAEDALTWSADLPAKEPDPSVSSASPTYSDLRNFRFQDATLTAAGTDRTADLQDLSVSIENGISPLYRGERTAGKMEVGERVITISLTLDYETADLYEAALGSSGATEVQDSVDTLAVNAVWTSPETIADTVQYELEFDAPSCVPNTHQANLDTNSLVGEEVELRAIVDQGGLGHEAEFTLKNGVTSEYTAA